MPKNDIGYQSLDMGIDMIRLVLLLILFLVPVSVFAVVESKVPDWQPSIGSTPDFSNEAIKAFKKRDELLARYNQLSSVEESELRELLKRYPEPFESIWDVEGRGCSWYCGGGPYKIESSSHLPPSKVSDYDAKNAHDFTFKTAWVEGVEGYGEGESISYYFKNDSPRIHTIKIYNGYIKSSKAWNENSRVRSLLLMENNTPLARLHLQDTSALQSFRTELLGRRKDGKDLVLKFVIEEVYPGTKYADTAITGIYFDGTDVH